MVRQLFLLLLLINYINSEAFCQTRTYNIADFGAKGDGRTLNTAFIQKAIDKATAAGGGKVIVPKGRFVTGTIRLKNGVHLFLQKDAVLLGSTNRLHYGKEVADYLINTTDQKKVSITGYGEIDGQGREVVKNLFKLLHQGILQDAQWKIKRPGEKNRPGVIAFTGCTDVQVQVPAGKPDMGYPVEGPPQKFPHNVFPASIVGLPGHAVEDVELKNIIITYEGGGMKEKACFGWDSLSRVPENASGYPEFSMFGELPSWALYVRHAKGITLQNVQLKLQQTDYRPACVFDDVQALQLDEVNIPVCNTLPVMVLNNVKEHRFYKLSLPVEESKGVIKLFSSYVH